MEDSKTKYQELITVIMQWIEDGSLKPGSKLPSENDLSETYRISRQTVRKAIGILEEQGIVRRVRGSGTYVNDRRRENLEKHNRVAVITTYLDSYIFPKIIMGIEQSLFERGFSVQMSFTNNTIERERTVLKDILKRDDVAGIIVEGTRSGLPNPNLDLYRKLMGRNIPILFINTFYPELKVPHVSINDVEAARGAVDYLIACGHSKIGTIQKLDDGQGRLRYLGYLKAMQGAGLPVCDRNLVWVDTREAEELSDSRDKVIKRLQDCSAILCYNDQIAFQVIKMLRSQGIRIPEDISVVGIDDSDLARLSEIPITSMSHPKEQMGERAVAMLLEMIEGKTNIKDYEYEAQVVARGSVKKIMKEERKR